MRTGKKVMRIRNERENIMYSDYEEFYDLLFKRYYYYNIDPDFQEINNRKYWRLYVIDRMAKLLLTLTGEEYRQCELRLKKYLHDNIKMYEEMPRKLKLVVGAEND